MLSWDYPPQTTGGIAAQVAGLGAALGAAGHEVVVLTIANRRADTETESVGNVRVRRAKIDLPWLPADKPLARTASANHALTALGATLDSDSGGWRPDIIHGHDWSVGWAADTLAAIHDVPFVLTMHGTERIRHGGHLPQGTPTDISSIEWWLAFRADRLISSTRFMVEQLVTGFELAPERVERIPNGIDPERWAGRPEEEPGRERGRHVVTWGRVQFEKGFQVLARAINQVRASIPDVQCTIAGRGSYLPELQTQIDVEGVSDLIDLPGYVADDALHELARNAGCVVIPSLYEPFGIVALEALAAGAPLIVAHTGGLAELVDGTGASLTFEPGNSDDLGRCIDRVLRDPVLGDEMTANARDLVHRRFSWDAIATETAAVYHSVCEQRR